MEFCFSFSQYSLCSHSVGVAQKALCVAQNTRLCQQKKYRDQNRDSCRLNMFNVAQKRNKCRKKIISVAYN